LIGVEALKAYSKGQSYLFKSAIAALKKGGGYAIDQHRYGFVEGVA
jgi:hypothetical protein